jgi:hypothetical protein
LARLADEPHDRELDAEAICRGLFYLLQRLPKADYLRTIFEIHDQLSALAARLQAPVDALDVVEYVKPVIEPVRDPRTREVVLTSITYPNQQKLTEYFAPERPPGSFPWRIRHDASPEIKKLLKKGPPSRQ